MCKYYVDLIISFEQTRYTTLENASSATGFEVCVVIVNGPGIVPQMNMDVMVFATNGSDGGNLKHPLNLVVFCVTLRVEKCICTDTAEAGEDFIPLTSTLTFGLRSPGRLCGTVAVIVDDSIVENDEDFTVFLQADSSVVVFDDRSSVVVSIISDDGKLI